MQQGRTGDPMHAAPLATAVPAAEIREHNDAERLEMLRSLTSPAEAAALLPGSGIQVSYPATASLGMLLLSFVSVVFAAFTWSNYDI